VLTYDVLTLVMHIAPSSSPPPRRGGGELKRGRGKEKKENAEYKETPF